MPKICKSCNEDKPLWERRYYKENAYILKAKKKAKYHSDPERYKKETWATKLRQQHS